MLSRTVLFRVYPMRDTSYFLYESLSMDISNVDSTTLYGHLCIKRRKLTILQRHHLRFAFRSLEFGCTETTLPRQQAILSFVNGNFSAYYDSREKERKVTDF